MINGGSFVVAIEKYVEADSWWKNGHVKTPDRARWSALYKIPRYRIRLFLDVSIFPPWKPPKNKETFWSIASDFIFLQHKYTAKKERKRIYTVNVALSFKILCLVTLRLSWLRTVSCWLCQKLSSALPERTWFFEWKGEFISLLR